MLRDFRYFSYWFIVVSFILELFSLLFLRRDLLRFFGKKWKPVFVYQKIYLNLFTFKLLKSLFFLIS